MSKFDDATQVVDQLRAAFSQMGAEQGIENVALRAVTGTIGRSTTAVFQHFGSKEGLLRASMEDAFERDCTFHDQLLASLSDLPVDPQVLSTTAYFYITRRVRCEPAQLWLEGLFKSRQFPELRPILSGWHAMRQRFWARLLGSGQGALADLLATYTSAEEAYAAALIDEPAYHLLLRDTASRLFSRPPAGAARAAAGRWAEEQMPPLGFAERRDDSETAQRLLDQAARVILRRGAADLNVRRVAADAETAPSQIIYHFGDFATFRRQAIVAVLMRGLPVALDPNRPVDTHAEAAEWANDLGRAAQADRSGQPAGFYVDYARVLGQACLLAKRDATLRTLAMQLRTIEGSGIFHLSQAQWPVALRLDRDGAATFAIWIKGHAILNEAFGASAGESLSEPLVEAATQLTR